MVHYVVLLFFLVATVAASDYRCTNQGGSCVDYRYYVCNGGVENGLCDGDSNRRCCLECDNSCQSDVNNWESCCDSACTSISGSCQDNSNYCDGSYSSGKCGGPSDRQCCSKSTGGSSGSCSLLTYSTSSVKGYNGLTIEIEPGFKSSMDSISSYASSCGVTVWVTHAFRYEGQDLGGTVVPPASNSNHLVGHAIDMNLDTPSGWCNGDCLYAGYNSNAECFLNKVMNGGLRWGGVWYPTDPVHIDDGLNVYSPNTWNDLYYDLQGNC
uniref:Lysozyme 3-like n=1 Tax=Ciona intestinalis TaxID=7719 RepID=F6ZYU7_CIOIN|nr:lysozyme 3-like [Ciona intestinalis]|eukprot:XP_002122335.1 lysozyme 3-like [Ciona intestinalis]